MQETEPRSSVSNSFAAVVPSAKADPSFGVIAKRAPFIALAAEPSEAFFWSTSSIGRSLAETTILPSPITEYPASADWPATGTREPSVATVNANAASLTLYPSGAWVSVSVYTVLPSAIKSPLSRSAIPLESVVMQRSAVPSANVPERMKLAFSSFSSALRDDTFCTCILVGSSHTSPVKTVMTVPPTAEEVALNSTGTSPCALMVPSAATSTVSDLPGIV